MWCLKRKDVQDFGVFYFVSVAPLTTVSGSTSVETPAAAIICRRASAVGSENLKFIPRWRPTAIRRGVHPDTFLRFQTSTLAPCSARYFTTDGNCLKAAPCMTELLFLS